jgi:hypothetical protein
VPASNRDCRRLVRRVEALSPCWRMHVRGVSCQEHASDAVAIYHPDRGLID